MRVEFYLTKILIIRKKKIFKKGYYLFAVFP